MLLPFAGDIWDDSSFERLTSGFNYWKFDIGMIKYPTNNSLYIIK